VVLVYHHLLISHFTIICGHPSIQQILSLSLSLSLSVCLFWQGLTIQFRLALNSQPSCLTLLRSRITGMSHHTQPSNPFF
jgi:hypothetical protein